MNSINQTRVIDLTQSNNCANGIKIVIKNTVKDILSYLETQHIKIEIMNKQTGPVSIPVKIKSDNGNKWILNGMEINESILEEIIKSGTYTKEEYRIWRKINSNLSSNQF